MVLKCHNKDEDLLSVIEQVDRAISDNRLSIEDHWECDAISIGLVNKEKAGYLAYISLTNRKPGEIYFALEAPPANPEDIFETVGEGYVTLSEVIEVIRNHLFRCIN